MEKEKTGKVKEVFLAGFVMVCVALIFSLWMQAFTEKEVETPYFYRGAPEAVQFIQQTSTAAAVQTNSGTATTAPALATITPTPTVPVTPTLFITPSEDD